MWRSTCGVAEPLLQAELLLYTVVYCEVGRLWQWIDCIACNGYAVTQILLQATHTVGERFVTESWLHINEKWPASFASSVHQLCFEQLNKVIHTILQTALQKLK